MSLAGQGVKDRIPPGAVLVFEVELRKLKLGKEREADVATETLVFSHTRPKFTFPPLFSIFLVSLSLCVLILDWSLPLPHLRPPEREEAV